MNKRISGIGVQLLGIAASLVALAAARHPFSSAAANVCTRTADDVLRSCQTAAQADSQLALARCDNLLDPGAQRTCQTTAKTELSDALASCKTGADARNDACRRLGGAAYDPALDPANFVAGVDNPYFPLPPGTTFVYEGRTAQGLEHDEFEVTRNTRVILGVTCIEVHDVVTVDGEPSEDTLDWFAQDRDGNVWYFGENTHELADGLISTIDGTFMAGTNGDKPGIIMRATPVAGDFYRQEFSLGNAEDFAETLSLDETVVVPAGRYDHCLESQETTPLEPDLLERKYYAKGVGSVLTVDAVTGDRVELVRIRKN